MRERTKKTTGRRQPEEALEDENDITQPMRVICSQAGAPRSSRVYWLKKIGESARRQTPDWTEIGGQTEDQGELGPEISPEARQRGSR